MNILIPFNMITINRQGYKIPATFINAVVAAYNGAKEGPTIREVAFYRRVKGGRRKLMKLKHINPFRPRSQDELREMLEQMPNICRVEITNVPHIVF